MDKGSGGSVGMSAGRLERIGAAMQGYVDRGIYAGINTVVARRGVVVQQGQYGFRDKEAQQATYCIWFSNGADRLSVASTVRSNPSHRAAPTRAGSAVHLH